MLLWLISFLSIMNLIDPDQPLHTPEIMHFNFKEFGKYLETSQGQSDRLVSPNLTIKTMN